MQAQQGKFQLDIRKKIFTMRAVKHWKRVQNSSGLSITGDIQRSMRQGSEPNFGVSPASSSDLQTSQIPCTEGISGGLQRKLLLKPGPTRAGCSEPCPVWVCISPRTEVPQLLQAPILAFHHPHNEHFFSLDLSEFPVCPLPLVLPLRTCEESVSAFSTPSQQIVVGQQ